MCYDLMPTDKSVRDQVIIGILKESVDGGRSVGLSRHPVTHLRQGRRHIKRKFKKEITGTRRGPCRKLIVHCFQFVVDFLNAEDFALLVLNEQLFPKSGAKIKNHSVGSSPL